MMKPLLDLMQGGGKFLSLLLLLLLTAVTPAEAAKRTITGTVIDDAGLPVIGATVWLKDSSNGTQTDINGKYSLQIDGVGIIAFSFVGMETVEVALNDQKVIDVTLKNTGKALEEVVVVGYGVQRKESVIGSIASVDVTNLKVPSASLSTALAGQMAGIVSMTRSGEPGKNGAAEIYIRGVTTFAGSSTPLVLVDGIERDIDLVDLDDIATFSILKDASASAVYGVRGANGVVLITTRKGSIGKPEIAVRFQAGITQPTKMPSFSNSAQWAEMYNEATGTNYYSAEDIEKYRTNADPDLYPNVNWIDQLYKNCAYNERVNMNITGGSDICQYFVSAGFYNESSIFKNAGSTYDYDSSINYNKFNFRANVDFALTKTTKLSVNLANIYEKSFGPGSSTDDIWSYAFMTSPNAFPAQYSDGTIAAPSKASGYNPWNLLVHSGYREQYWNSAQSLIGLNQDLKMVTEGLSANIKFSWDAWNTTLQTRNKEPQQWHAIGRDDEGNLLYGTNPIYAGSESLSYASSNGSNRTVYLEGSINYDHTFGKHRVGALFLYNHKIYRNLTAGSQDASLPYKNQGIAARLTYSFNDRYFAEFNMGYNGSENFASGHRFGFFPAVSAGWMISNEKWFEPLRKVLTDVKLRASYGKVGNDQISTGRRWMYQATIVSGGGYSWGSEGQNGGTGIRVGEIANAAFSWEEATKLNVGAELNLFNQFRLQIDYFREDRSGILLQRAGLPALVGLSSLPYVNIGETRNEGIEFEGEWNKRIGDWSFSARGTFTFNRNTLLNNDEPDWKYKYQNVIGKPFGNNGYQPKCLVAMGLFESQEDIDNSPVQNFGTYRVGDIKYKDVNGDGVVDSNDITYNGYTNIPEITYGFGGTVQWKGIDFNVFFQGIGHTTFFLSGYSIRSPFSSNNMDRSAIQEDVYNNRWSINHTAEQNASATYPRLAYGSEAGSTNNSQASTWWQRNGSFLRLKNIEIGYSLPKTVMNKTFIKSLRFYVQATNLCTFSSFKLWDPEKASGSSDGSGYPPNRVVSVGINANF